MSYHIGDTVWATYEVGPNWGEIYFACRFGGSIAPVHKVHVVKGKISQIVIEASDGVFMIVVTKFVLDLDDKNTICTHNVFLTEEEALAYARVLSHNWVKKQDEKAQKKV